LSSARQDTWYQLDNAANLFPAVSGDKNTNVFRLSCELREPVQKDWLQQAVNTALRSFPHFRVVMRRGLFWHYLEPTDLSPVVEQEHTRPCSRIFYKGVKDLLFRVTYYRKRINLEVFHAISDGGGALEFLKAIVYHYLVLAHKDSLPSPLPAPPGGSTPQQKAEDSFERYYTPQQKDSVFKQKAYTIGGTLLPSGHIKVIEARVSTKGLLALAKQKGVTITSYLAALLLLSIYHELMPRRALGKTVGVTVPVDLRGHFTSRSTRNFFSVVGVGYQFSQLPQENQLDAVLASVSQQLTHHTRSDALAQRINYTMGIQKHPAARFTPLFIKNMVLKAAYQKAEACTTCALSNLGRITMPDCFDPYIDRFTCLLNPTSHHRLKLAVCSYGDQLTLSFSSVIVETGAQTWFLRYLAEQGLDVVITCNGGYDHEIL